MTGLMTVKAAVRAVVLAPTVASTLNCKLMLFVANPRLAAACRRDCGAAGAPPHLTAKIYILLDMPGLFIVGEKRMDLPWGQ